MLLDNVRNLVRNLRRDIEPKSSFAEFRSLVEGNIADICRDADTKWLVSICDTYADFGDSVERRNAMLISVLVKMEKAAQSYLMWRVNYETPFEVPAGRRQRTPKLWDGMNSFHLTVGDMTNEMFRRMDDLLRESAHLHRIFEEILERLRTNPTILGAINAHHGHIFELDTEWRKDPRYAAWHDRWRAMGRL